MIRAKRQSLLAIQIQSLYIERTNDVELNSEEKLSILEKIIREKIQGFNLLDSDKKLGVLEKVIQQLINSNAN